MTIHPLCDLFPAMTDSELQDLANDIKANGQHETIVTLDGMILDGRNRFNACELVNVTPRLITFKGKDPLAFVLSKNLHRRHLSESQRGMIAARLATNPHGGDRTSEQGANLRLAVPTLTQDEAAEKLNVSERTVQNAKKVLKEGTAEDVLAVDLGEKTVARVIEEIEERKDESYFQGRKKSECKVIAIHIPAHERHYITLWIPKKNWSEICCRALMSDAKQAEELERLRGMRDGKL
jgi:ParB-like chromosome segregation protein Spo0J